MVLPLRADLLSKLQNTINQSTDDKILLEQAYTLIIANHVQGKHAQLLLDQVKALCRQFSLTTSQLGLKILPLIKCYAVPQISDFYVGAIVEDLDGNFYFGANLELKNTSIQVTSHAEQSAISNALNYGSRGIKNLMVNYAPCGHCRQFINEVNTSHELTIYLPQIPEGKKLNHFLADSFGPLDLGVKSRLFDFQNAAPYIDENNLDQVIFEYARTSYNPYTHSRSAVVMKAGDDYFTGKYIENAAFNPSYPPVTACLNQVNLAGKDFSTINKIYLVQEKNPTVNQASITNNVANVLGLQLKIFTLYN